MTQPAPQRCVRCLALAAATQPRYALTDPGRLHGSVSWGGSTRLVLLTPLR